MVAKSTEKELKFFLEQEITVLSGVGEKTALLFAKLEIYTIYDLLNHFPRAWIDLRNETEIAKLRIGDLAIIEATPQNIRFFKTKTTKMAVISADLMVGEQKISAMWFNQIFMQTNLQKIRKAIFVGKVEYNKTFGKYISSAKIFYSKEIIPIYPLTAGLGQYSVRKLIKEALRKVKFMDFLSGDDYPSINFAYNQIHYPKDLQSLDIAKNRLALNEMIYISLVKKIENREKESYRSISFPPNFDQIKKNILKLPFNLTNSQRKEIFQICNLLNSTTPMQRLLQGDVGSGKTIVAALTAIQVVQGGKQVFLMAPTEILAKQHYNTFKKILSEKIKIALVTGSKKGDWKNAQIIIGTHALIQESINTQNAGYVIIDEQHRFGTSQRNKLVSGKSGIAPHYLAMSATPIPRSLALIIYGDVSLGRLNELPSGRKKVMTKVFNESERVKVYKFVDTIIQKGEQVFIICPAIEFESDISLDSGGQVYIDLDKKAVANEFNKLKDGYFKHRRLAMLHGKMKPTEKNKILDEFRKGEYDILISTSVIEVGIDIPKASAIIIENADRFGLAQLHQFRGRVGRAGQQAYCFLNDTNDYQNKRLSILEKTFDGYKLANEDLRLRGPGDFIGSRQSGLPDFKMAKFWNIIMLDEAKAIAESIINKKIPLILHYYVERFIKKRNI